MSDIKKYGVLFHFRYKNPQRDFYALDDVMYDTLEQALDVAYAGRNDEPVCLFELNVSVGFVVTLKNNIELDEYIEARRRNEMSESERKAEIEATRADDMRQ